MKKKWLVAVFVSEREGLLKFWRGKVSDDIDITDISLPENTMFFFFSNCEEMNLEIIQLKLSDKGAIALLGKEINELVYEHKIYCCAQRKNNSLILKNLNYNIVCNDFCETFKQENFIIEFV